jgi:hypothetical protein
MSAPLPLENEPPIPGCRRATTGLGPVWAFVFSCAVFAAVVWWLR